MKQLPRWFWHSSFPRTKIAPLISLMNEQLIQVLRCNLLQKEPLT